MLRSFFWKNNMKKIISKNPWLLIHSNPEATLRLFCFPYAGGSATIFRKWSDNLPENIEICAIQLPGRGSRMREKPHTQINDLINDLHSAIASTLAEKPFVFLGHSMGALLAFELCHLLEKQPEHLIVSGHRAPQEPATYTPIYKLSDQEFLEELKDLGGMQKQILDNKELMDMLIPILRADFSVCDTYQYRNRTRLDCNITAMGGIQDSRTTKENLALWKKQTTNLFSLSMLPGEHFFIHSHENLYFEVVNRILYSLI